MITVVTPSYNQGNFIRATIESVLTQPVRDLEYIIMDGGSTDETVDILKKYGERIYWESKPDKGQADAVNQGILKAKGDIIGWINSDDIYYPDALSIVESIFQENSSVNVIYGDANHIDEHGEIIEPYYTEDFSYERLQEICFLCQPAVFFRKNLVDKYGGLNISLQYCMDYEYWLRLAKNETFMRVDNLFAGSRLYNENKTLGARRKVHEEIVKMFKNSQGKVPSTWVYNLAHVICDDLDIPRECGGRTNPRYAGQLARTSYWLLLKYNHRLSPQEKESISAWKKYAKEGENH